MKLSNRIATLFAITLLVAGCSAAKTTSGHYYASRMTLERPGNILVYDFAANVDDLPHGIPLGSGYVSPSTPPTPEELQVGRALGAEVAKRLVQNIEEMGFHAEAATDDTPRNVNDLVLAGFFTSVDEGSRVKRMAIGFGSGSADVQTEAAGFLVTEQGLLMLGTRTVDSGGAAKGPGMIVPLAVTIATANPVGIIVGGAVKATNEVTGRSTVEGAAKRTADELTEQLRIAFQRRGWVE
jgi:hypothetical protein